MSNDEKILECLATIQQSIVGIQTDVAGLKTDVAGLKTDVAGLKTDVAELKTDVAELKTDVAGLKTDVAVLQTDVADLKERVTKLEDESQFIKGVVIKIETEHGRKLDAFYDGYKANFELISRFDPRVTKLERDVEKHTFQIQYLEEAR